MGIITLINSLLQVALEWLKFKRDREGLDLTNAIQAKADATEAEVTRLMVLGDAASIARAQRVLERYTASVGVVSTPGLAPEIRNPGADNGRNLRGPE